MIVFMARVLFQKGAW